MPVESSPEGVLTSVRVVVVDDEPMIREMLTAMVERTPGMSLAGAAVDGHDAVNLVKFKAVDVVLMDIRMPGLDGIEATKEIRRRGTKPRVLLLTALTDDELAEKALRAGADGFLLKSDQAAIVGAILALAGGATVMSAGPRNRLLPRGDRGSAPNLTKRESAVLALVCTGCTNRQIGADLGLAVPTVKGHVTVIMGKFGVSNRTELTTRAHELGLGRRGTGDSGQR